jgi:hypothetical protein
MWETGNKKALVIWRLNITVEQRRILTLSKYLLFYGHQLGRSKLP